MNGKNGLACITPLSEVVRGEKLTIKPLPGLPVIRDLIVDMEQFYSNYEKVNPYLINDEEPPEKERLQSPEDRRSLTGCMSVFCARVAQHRAPRFGGIPISLLARPGCCRLIGSSQTAGIQQQKIGFLI